MVKASEQVTVQTLDSTKTMSFDEAEGLTIASDDGKTKVVVSDESISIYQNSVKVAEFNKEALKLGMNGTAENGTFIDLLNGLGKISAFKPYSSSAVQLQMKSNSIDIRAEDEFANGSNIFSFVDTSVEKYGSNSGVAEIRLYCTDPSESDITHPVEIWMKADSYGASFIDLESKNIMRNGFPFFHWTLIKQTMAEETIVGLEDAGYSEFLLTCQIDPKGGQGYEHERVMASTIIPAEAFFGYTTDHGNGASQAYYNSTYNSGVSYLGNNKVKLYHPSGCYARLYAR